MSIFFFFGSDTDTDSGYLGDPTVSQQSKLHVDMMEGIALALPCLQPRGCVKSVESS